MTTDQQIQLLVSILTIAASGVISAVVTYKLTDRRDRRERLRQKLEDVHAALGGWCNQLGVDWITYQSVMVGEINYIRPLT